MTTEIFSKIKEMGTPAFLFDEGAFKERLHEIDRILNGEYEEEKRIKICYAAKANPFLLTAAAEVVDR